MLVPSNCVSLSSEVFQQLFEIVVTVKTAQERRDVIRNVATRSPPSSFKSFLSVFQ